MKKTASFLLVLIILSLISPMVVFAQYPSLEPRTATKKVGELFTVDVKANPEGKMIKGVDVSLTYDPSILEVVSVENGGLFPKGGNNVDAAAGTIYFSYGFDQPLQSTTTAGTYAKLVLKGKKTGSANLNFVCTADTNETNMMDVAGNDIVKCASIVNGVYTITEGGSTPPTATPTPASSSSGSSSSSSGSSAAATPTPYQTGISYPTILGIGAGMLLTIFGLAFSI